MDNGIWVVQAGAAPGGNWTRSVTPGEYATGEHAYQAAKATTEADHLMIALSPTPGDSKAFGNTCDIRSDWEQVKVEIMRKVIAAKFPFDKDHTLSLRLVNTGTAVLIEGTNWNDKVWGVAFDREKHQIEGRNLLGVLLMERRGVLHAVARGLL